MSTKINKQGSKERQKELRIAIHNAFDTGDLSAVDKFSKELRSFKTKRQKREWRKLELTVEEYKNYCAQGFSDKEIAYICETAQATLYQFKLRNKLPLGNFKITEEDKLAIRDLRASGMSAREIAAKYNIHRTYVAKLAKELPQKGA